MNGKGSRRDLERERVWRAVLDRQRQSGLSIRVSFGSSKPATRSADLIGQNQPVRFRESVRYSLETCRLIG